MVRSERNVSPWLLSTVFAAGALLLSGRAHAQAPLDTLGQAATRESAGLSSVGGDAQAKAISPEQLSRGVLAWPLPIELPGERVRPLAHPFPTYTPGAPLSEWGHGFQISLAVKRQAEVGPISFAGEEFSAPFGELVRGEGGRFFPRGVSPGVVVERNEDGFVARFPDGLIQRFTFAVHSSYGDYAYYLEEVTDLNGRVTRLTWVTNSSGRPFLERMSYGNRLASEQVVVELAYEPLESGVTSLESGDPWLLDRRVSKVLVFEQNGKERILRTEYTLRHEHAEHSPAFYLVGLEKRFASGSVAPPIAFAYDRELPFDAKQPLALLPSFAKALSLVGAAGLQPDRAARFDLERDGRTDFEHNFAQALLHRTDSGLEPEYLSERTSNVDGRCRPQPSASNAPRLLARVSAADATPRVQTLTRDIPGSTTVLVCDREGKILSGTQVPGSFTLDARTRLADLDNDYAPDLLQVTSGGVRVAMRASGKAFAFRAPTFQGLTTQFDPEAVFVEDVNGDGRPDLLLRRDGQLAAHLGRGDGTFLLEGRPVFVRNAQGQDFARARELSFTFADLNADGLLDLLLTGGAEAHAFTHRGELKNGAFLFSQVALAWPSAARFSNTVPLLGNFSDSGDLELLHLGTREAKVMRLSRPSTGLLTEVREAGRTLRLTWKRVDPIPGIGTRMPVVARIDVRASGEHELANEVSYGLPAFHSRSGRMLGFESVRVVAGVSVHEVKLRHDDDVQGLLLEKVLSDSGLPDALPELARVTRHHYEQASFRGVSFPRKKWTDEGWVVDGVEQLERREVAQFHDQRCEERVVTRRAGGTLTTESTYATPRLLAALPTCLTETVTTRGVHSDARLDFAEQTRSLRDDRGVVVSVERGAPGALHLREQLTFDELGRKTRALSSTGQVESFGYEGATELIAWHTDAAGITQRVLERHPITLSPTHWVTDHEPKLHISFRYDGRERLVGTRFEQEVRGELTLLHAVARSYRDVSTTLPALTIEQLGTDVMVADHAAPTTVTVLSGGGQTLGVARAIERGFAFAAQEHIPSLGLVRSHAQAVLDASPESWTFAALEARRGVVRSEVRSSQLGWSISSRALLEGGRAAVSQLSRVERKGSLMELTHTRGTGERATERSEAMDATGTVWSVREGGRATTSFVRDALGRVRRVILPGGTRHEIDFDGEGRAREIRRDGLGTRALEYDPVTGLLRLDTVRNQGHVAQTDLEYDERGRIVLRLHSGSDTAVEVRYGFDGVTSDMLARGLPPRSAEKGPSQGQLTAVWTSAGFSKDLAYDLKGRVVQSAERVDLDGKVFAGTLTLDFDQAGQLELQARDINDGTRRTSYTDLYLNSKVGDVDRIERDKSVLLDFGHDALGRVETVYGPSADRELHVLREAQTGIRYGLETYASDGLVHKNQWILDAAGRVEHESLFTATDSKERSFSYDERGFLASASGTGKAADEADSFAYDANGVLDTGHEVERDAAGRVRSLREKALSYDAAGNLVSAVGADLDVRFVYDDAGKRVLELLGDEVRRVELAGNMLVRGALIERVEQDGMLLGTLIDGKLEARGRDLRGSPVSNAGMCEPFGTAHTESAVGFAGGNELEELGIVRFGVRDYDPESGRFLTPDPLMLAEPSRCLAHPVECELYAYAANDPLSGVDPTGLAEQAPRPIAEVEQSLEQRPAKLAAAWDKFSSAFTWDGSVEYGLGGENNAARMNTKGESIIAMGLDAFSYEATFDANRQLSNQKFGFAVGVAEMSYETKGEYALRVGPTVGPAKASVGLVSGVGHDARPVIEVKGEIRTPPIAGNNFKAEFTQSTDVKAAGRGFSDIIGAWIDPYTMLVQKQVEAMFPIPGG